MVVKINNDALMDNLKELCTTLISQPAYKELRQMIEQFTTDSEAMSQYEQFVNKNQQLLQKEQQGLEMQEEEIEDYNQEEQKLYANPVIRKFLYAQQEFDKTQQFISKYVLKSVELSRLPKPEELKHDSSCGCGGACGSGH